MLTITARLLHGTIRAGSPSDTVMAGGDPTGEWPPSPARIFSALVASDGTRDRCRVTDGTELAALEHLGPPRIYADDPSSVEWTDLPPRFVVKDERSAGMTQNYPGRSNTEIRPGCKTSPRHTSIAYVWDGDISDDAIESLRARARRIGYLGCADSPVQVTVTSNPAPVELTEWVPGAPHGVQLPVPYRGFTDNLDLAYDTSARRAWIQNSWERYGHPQAAADVLQAPTVIWLEFDRAVAADRALLVSATLRASLLERVDRQLPTESGVKGYRAPWVLHGHDVPTHIGRYQLARYLPLSNVGHRHADGSIHGAAIWLPPDSGAEVIELVRTATHGLRRLCAPGLDVAVQPRTADRGRRTTHPERWSARAKFWFSATPAVAERGRRGGPTEDDVRAWFRNAGHPEPTLVRVSPVPTGPGVPRLTAREVHRSGKGRHPFFWLDVGFDEAVVGPLCVGRNRSLGMGLMAPAWRAAR